jgi:hypothetical protein
LTRTLRRRSPASGRTARLVAGRLVAAVFGLVGARVIAGRIPRGDRLAFVAVIFERHQIIVAIGRDVVQLVNVPRLYAPVDDGTRERSAGTVRGKPIAVLFKSSEP